MPTPNTQQNANRSATDLRDMPPQMRASTLVSSSFNEAGITCAISFGYSISKYEITQAIDRADGVNMPLYRVQPVGKTMTVAGMPYVILERSPDGTGLTKLTLTEGK